MKPTETKTTVKERDECLLPSIVKESDKSLTKGNNQTFEEKIRMMNERRDIFNKNNWEPKEIIQLENAANYPNSSLLKIDVDEIVGLRKAVDYLQSILLKKEAKITEDVILELHRRVLGRVNPEESGVYRSVQVTVGGHKPPDPEELESLMTEFFNWLNSDDAKRLHPIRYAAMAHFKLVSIHPFVDGNGRVSRLLMNLVLLLERYPIVIIKNSKKRQYFKAIRDGNPGDISPFIRFVAQEVEETLDFFLSAMSDLCSCKSAKETKPTVEEQDECLLQRTAKKI